MAEYVVDIDLSTGRQVRREATPAEEAVIVADRATALLLAQREGQERAERGTARALVLSIAQGAVGKRFDALTLTERNALQLVMLWQAGGLTATGHIKPLAQWVKDE